MTAVLKNVRRKWFTWSDMVALLHSAVRRMHETPRIRPMPLDESIGLVARDVGALDRADQRVSAHRLGEKFDRTRLHRPHGHRDIDVAADEDDQRAAGVTSSDPPLFEACVSAGIGTTLVIPRRKLSAVPTPQS